MAKDEATSTPELEEDIEDDLEDEIDGGGLNPGMSGVVCVGKGIGAAISGGIIGGLYGFVAGAFKARDWDVMSRSARSSSNNFAIMGGIHTAVLCVMESVRATRDPLNSMAAGCATGAALGYSGGWQAAGQGCLGFGAFSYIIDAIQPQAQGASQQHPFFSSQPPSPESVLSIALPPLPAPLQPLVGPLAALGQGVQEGMGLKPRQLSGLPRRRMPRRPSKGRRAGF